MYPAHADLIDYYIKVTVDLMLYVNRGRELASHWDWVLSSIIVPSAAR